MSIVGPVPKGGSRKARRAAAAARPHRATERAASRRPAQSGMPAWGWKRPWNLYGPGIVTPPAHRASSKIVGAAYPFLAETGQALDGAYVGRDVLARSAFCFDPWAAYQAGVISSHSMVILGQKGAGKSMLAKSLATRLARLGRRVAVPHDPNGEWAAVARWVGGRVIQIGAGRTARLNLLDPGPRDPDLSAADWQADLLQYRRATIRAVARRLRAGREFADAEHTALDLALEAVSHSDVVTVTHVYDALLDLTAKTPDRDVADAGRRLGHTLRRVVEGDLVGLFDGPSTVTFDADAPMMVVDTSALKGLSPEAQALARLATANWVRRATTGGNRRARVIVHEEAAVELLNDVAGGAGLTERVQDEKVARHLGTSNWYVLHRIADLDALGDAGSSMQQRALGLLADCATRVSYSTTTDQITRSANALGWNDTIAARVLHLDRGEGIWQIGPDRVTQVRNVCTPVERGVFATDQYGGDRS